MMFQGRICLKCQGLVIIVSDVFMHVLTRGKSWQMNLKVFCNALRSKPLFALRTAFAYWTGDAEIR